MIDAELLDILCCPETKQPVALLSEEVVARVNDAIVAGKVETRGGDKVTEKIDGGLLREDRAVLYPIRDQIPIMLQDEAIPFAPFDGEA